MVMPFWRYAFVALCTVSSGQVSSGQVSSGQVSSGRASSNPVYRTGAASGVLPLDSVAPRERSPEGGNRQPPDRRRTKAASIQLVAVKATRGIPTEVIRRILRQNYGRYRLCYELGLARRPKLRGDVKVGFVVKRDGRTSSAKDEGSTLANASVVRCMAKAHDGLSFPKLEGDWAGSDAGTMDVHVWFRLMPE